MIRFIVFCFFTLNCYFNLHGHVDYTIIFNNLTSKKLTINCPKNAKFYKLTDGVYEEKEEISDLDFNEKSKYKFIFENDISVTIRNNSKKMATVDLKDSDEPRIHEETRENTICRMYNNELGEHIVVISDNEEKISREISDLEDSGMPKQWFLQK